MTRSEQALWNRLKPGLEGYRFKAQVPILGYVVDFYCQQLKMVVEVDGSSHWGKAPYDRLRDDDLRANHLHVLRLPSTLILNDMEAALATIRAGLQHRAKLLRRPRRQIITTVEVEMCRHGQDALLCRKCKLVEQAVRQPQQLAGETEPRTARRTRGSGRGRYAETPGLVNRPPSPPNTISRQGF